MKNIHLNIFKVLGVSVFIFVISLSFYHLSHVLGQDNEGGQAVNLLGHAGNALNNFYPSVSFNIGSFLLVIIGIRNFILFLGIVLGVIFIVLGGINYMRSEGDESKVSTARNQIVGGIIGLTITIAVFTIMNFLIDFVRSRTGISVLQ